MALSRRVLLFGDSAASLCFKQLIHPSGRALPRPRGGSRYLHSSMTVNRIAGDVFGWQASLPWEFTNNNPVNSPIRSILPIWMVYGLPMRFIKHLYGSNFPLNAQADGLVNPDPMVLFRALRLTFFCLSFLNGTCPYCLLRF